MRETKTITTPNGNSVELYTYLTGKEAREYQQILLGSVKAQPDSEGEVKMQFSEISGEAVAKLIDKAIELMVVSVDGQKGNVRELAEALRVEDYNAVATEAQSFFRT